LGIRLSAVLRAAPIRGAVLQLLIQCRLVKRYKTYKHLIVNILCFKWVLKSDLIY